jgi:hypothetical protein
MVIFGEMEYRADIGSTGLPSILPIPGVLPPFPTRVQAKMHFHHVKLVFEARSFGDQRSQPCHNLTLVGGSRMDQTGFQILGVKMGYDCPT